MSRCHDFYSNLHSSRYCEATAKSFIDSVSHCKVISSEERDACGLNVSHQEVMKAVGNLNNNKSSWCDGLTAELYKMFDEQLSLFLVKVFSEKSSPNKYDSRCHHFDSQTKQRQGLSRELASYHTLK